MEINFKHFKENLPQYVIDVFDFCLENDFEPSLIGGIPRDYLIKNIIGNDFDVCIRPLTSIDQILPFQRKLLEKYPQATEKKYGVIDLGNNVEISFPRREIFNGDINHSNFEIEYLQDLDYAEDILRRDFSLNAISFTFRHNQFVLNDPLGGVIDIKNRILRACSYQQFVKDPVRFLRAIRFHILLDFEFESNTEEIIKNMQLDFSPHYLRYEAKKSKRPLTFLLMIDYFQEGFLGLNFEDKNDDILEYENYLYQNDLYEHLRHAYFLSRKTRQEILKKFGLKNSQIWEIPFANIDLFELKQLDLEHFPKLSYIGDLLKFFENAANFDSKVLTYFQFIKPVAPIIFHDYKKCQVTVPKDIEPKLRSFFIFREKLKEIL